MATLFSNNASNKGKLDNQEQYCDPYYQSRTHLDRL